LHSRLGKSGSSSSVASSEDDSIEGDDLLMDGATGGLLAGSFAVKPRNGQEIDHRGFNGFRGLHGASTRDEVFRGDGQEYGESQLRSSFRKSRSETTGTSDERLERELRKSRVHFADTPPEVRNRRFERSELEDSVIAPLIGRNARDVRDTGGPDDQSAYIQSPSTRPAPNVALPSLDDILKRTREVGARVRAILHDPRDSSMSPTSVSSAEK